MLRNSKKEVNSIFYKCKDIQMKIWDIGGQFQYRQNWIDYAKMANVILYMVDSSNVKINHFNINITIIFNIV